MTTTITHPAINYPTGDKQLDKQIWEQIMEQASKNMDKRSLIHGGKFIYGEEFELKGFRFRVIKVNHGSINLRSLGPIANENETKGRSS